jgi:hypothetical protein
MPSPGNSPGPSGHREPGAAAALSAACDRFYEAICDPRATEADRIEAWEALEQAAGPEWGSIDSITWRQTHGRADPEAEPEI